ncbi:MAG: serine/threonine-protein kinase [Pirellulales bacterium]
MSIRLSNDDWDERGNVPGFELIELVGCRISHSIYRAIRLADARPVALKIFVEAEYRASALKRFENEQRVSGLLTNSQRIEIFEIAETTQGLPVLCMELVEGQTLRSLLQAGHSFSQGEVIAVMLQVCEYLTDLHGVGFVHGDIKPANIMRVDSRIKETRANENTTAQFQIKVLDLGVSREINDRGSSVETTKSEDSQQLVAGSPSYMAPELVLAPQKCNPSSDIYALGCTAYELIAGMPPFVGNNVLQVLLKHRNQTAAKFDSSRVDGELNRLIMSCLEKKVQDRPKGAAELLDVLPRI